MLNLTNPSSIVQSAIRRYSKVSVVGTCDSPVSLMGMIASVLKVPAGQLEFEIGGMHHFGWVSGVRQNGVERLPEVLQRAAEMPKLGVDPEVIQALGVIPSFYAKYYFHPDRILAATVGRKIRAHELMEFSEIILKSYRSWKPGMPTGFVDQRGAAWYEKIVVPTLLALAEKQTTELVLSVDNNGALPWLPPDAIVEAAVPIVDGKLQPARGACLPQDIQAMLVQNCAYEMLAAEAIVEKDRDKALRALLSNLLVSNFNQARGILQLVWPGESKYSPKIEIAPASKQVADELKTPTLHYGETLLESTETARARLCYCHNGGTLGAGKRSTEVPAKSGDLRARAGLVPAGSPGEGSARGGCICRAGEAGRLPTWRNTWHGGGICLWTPSLRSRRWMPRSPRASQPAVEVT